MATLLHKLARVNKHQDFTAQTRVETPQTSVQGRSAGISWSGNASIRVTGNAEIRIEGVKLDPKMNMPPPDSHLTVRRVLLIDWRFVDPPVSVLGTLKAIVRLTHDAVHDVRSAAGL